jgi:lipoate-protein ligase A
MKLLLRRDEPGADPAADIDAELALLDAVLTDPARPILRLWQVKPCLVVTALTAQKPGFAAAAAESATRGWPVVVRRTGGGPVPQIPGTRNLSLAFAVPRAAAPDIDTAFAQFADPLCAALRGLSLTPEIGEVVGSCCPGRYDIAVAGRKFVGIAQRRRQGEHNGQLLTAVLVHAILWEDGDLAAGIDALERFLAEAGLPTTFARDRMATLRELAGAGDDLGDDRGDDRGGDLGGNLGDFEAALVEAFTHRFSAPPVSV